MKRRLTTILAADLAGYSRLMAADEEGVIDRLRAVRSEVIEPAVAEAGGRVVKTMGDGFLAEFLSPVEAVRAALAIHGRTEEAEASRPVDARLRFRIGVHLGDVVADGEDILGDAVNVAARLEGLAPVGGLCISRAVRDQVKGRIEAPLRALGPVRVKNLPDPVDAWVAGEDDGVRKGGEEDAPTLAVLPFEEIGAAEDDFFADGVVEEITSALSRAREFSVIARQSAVAFRGRGADIREAGRALGARYVVTGSIRRAERRVRISVQLASAVSGSNIWSERYDDDLDDLFELQDRIASNVAGAISPSVRASEIAAARAVTPADRGAYALFMSAYPHFWAHRREENERAIFLLTEALERNPDEFRARALRSWCHAQQACYIWTDAPLEARAKAVADAEAAALAAGEHAPSLVAIGAAFSMATLDQERARACINKALSLDPNSAWGWLRRGWNQVYLREPEAALESFARAEELSPRDPFLFNVEFGRASAHGLLGDFDAAVACSRKGLMAGPGVTWAYRDLASFYANVGKTEEAEEAMRSLLATNPNVTVRLVIDSVPPSMSRNQPYYLEGLRRAGIPDA